MASKAHIAACSPISVRYHCQPATRLQPRFAVGVMPEKALKLACNAQFREMLADESGVVSLPSELLAGAMTGFAQCSITTPMEIVKIRAQMAGPGTSTIKV